MKYFLLLLVVSIFFFQCKEWEKGNEPPVQKYSLAKLFETVRKIDSTSTMLRFKPDTGAIQFSQNLLHEFYPDPVLGLKGNVRSVIETELTPQRRGNPTVDYTKEHFFENGRPVKLIDNNPEDSLIQTLQYNAPGLLVEEKSVWPSEDNSLVKEYQYDSQNRLNKVLHFNGLDMLIRTTHFFYHKNGNLDSVFFEDTEGEDYSFKYYCNSKSKSFLQVRISERGIILYASLYELDEFNRTRYSEDYNKTDGTSIYTHQFEYDEHGDLKNHETGWTIDKEETRSRYSYTKRDSAGNWTEMLWYLDRNLFSITRRTITYK